MNSSTATFSAYAPGRVELLGNHTDYNEGVVLAAAIDRGVTVKGSSRRDGLISLSSKIGRRVEVPVAHLRPQNDERWSNYPLGVVSELIAQGIPITGFSANVDGNVPAGRGLSSSGAFEVATALFLLKLFQAELPALEIAKLCQRAEHRFVQVQSGLLDQVTSIFGRAEHAVLFDARTETVRQIAFPAGFALVISDSGKRELAAGKYNERQSETDAAAQKLGIAALRDISSTELAARHDLDPLLRKRALHVVGEIERVVRAVDLLALGDGAGFGALMNESHESSRINFENSTAELDLLVELARKIPGVLGARLTGGGFGGATVTLCQRTHVNFIAEKLSRLYADQTGLRSQVFVCAIADGAG